MVQTLASLAALIFAASLVNLANSTLTTVMPLRMLEDDASGMAIALFGAAFFLGFALGCFTQPSLIRRVGYIRAFAVAASVCSGLSIIMDLSDSIELWLALRFLMGIAVASIFAAVDGWINGTASHANRGRVFAIYGWLLGSSAVLSQMILIYFDGMVVGFIIVISLAFNIALVILAMTRTVPPDQTSMQAEGSFKLVFTSRVSVGTAFYAGLVTTAILSILPAVLVDAGVVESYIGTVIGAFFLGRLLLQIPIGIIADKVDQRRMVAIMASLIGVTAIAGAALIFYDSTVLLISGPGRTLFLLVMLILGGLVLPLYTLANSLAFMNASGRPAIQVATSLLLINSTGAVAGPLLVAAMTPVFEHYALSIVIASASTLMALLAVRHSGQTTRGDFRPSKISTIPTTSVASTRIMADDRSTPSPTANPQTTSSPS